jgi:hypothetical protein
MMVGITIASLIVLIVVYMGTNEARVARVAKLVVTSQADIVPRVTSNEEDIGAVKKQTVDGWTRTAMALWCVEFTRVNPDVKCPSPYLVSPQSDDNNSISKVIDRIQARAKELEDSIKAPPVPQPRPSS